MEDCSFCGERKCEGCPLEYTDKKTYEDLLTGLKVQGNESFYSNDYSTRGRNEVILEISLASNVEKEIFEPFTTSIKKGNKEENKDGKEEKKDGGITLDDCLEEFKLPE